MSWRMHVVSNFFFGARGGGRDHPRYVTSAKNSEEKTFPRSAEMANEKFLENIIFC